MTLAKVIEQLLGQQNSGVDLSRDCFKSLLETLVRLKEVQDEMEEDEDGEAEEDGEEDDGDDDDSEVGNFQIILYEYSFLNDAMFYFLKSFIH